MSGISIRHHGRTAMEMFNQGVEQHKQFYNGALPYRVTLGSDWQEEMQHKTSLTVEGQEVIVGYRRNQDRYTVSCDTTKQGNRKTKVHN